MSTTLLQPEQQSVVDPAAAPVLDEAPALHRFTIEQYHKIVAAGVFDSEVDSPNKIEFLDGVFVEMSPPGYPHRRAIDELTYWAVKYFPRDGWQVSVQQPIQLINSRSVPEPDVAVYRTGGWGMNHPKAEHAGLVVEVAHSTLVHDLGYKMRLYARGGVGEYWVCDVENKKIVVHRAPENGLYGSIETFAGATPISPLVMPTATITPTLIFEV